MAQRGDGTGTSIPPPNRRRAASTPTRRRPREPASAGARGFAGAAIHASAGDDGKRFSSARSQMTPAEARSLFPVLERRAYLNAGSVGPLSRHTSEAMQSAERAAMTEGRGAASLWEAASATQVKARERIATILGVPVE